MHVYRETLHVCREALHACRRTCHACRLIEFCNSRIPRENSTSVGRLRSNISRVQRDSARLHGTMCATQRDSVCLQRNERSTQRAERSMQRTTRRAQKAERSARRAVCIVREVMSSAQKHSAKRHGVIAPAQCGKLRMRRGKLRAHGDECTTPGRMFPATEECAEWIQEQRGQIAARCYQPRQFLHKIECVGTR